MLTHAAVEKLLGSRGGSSPRSRRAPGCTACGDKAGGSEPLWGSTLDVPGCWGGTASGLDVERAFLDVSKPIPEIQMMQAERTRRTHALLIKTYRPGADGMWHAS